MWGNCLTNQQNRITKLEKRAARIILDANLSIPSFDLFKELKCLLFPKYVEYQLAATVYKSLSELNSHYMNKPFSGLHLSIIKAVLTTGCFYSIYS